MFDPQRFTARRHVEIDELNWMSGHGVVAAASDAHRRLCDADALASQARRQRGEVGVLGLLFPHSNVIIIAL